MTDKHSDTTPIVDLSGIVKAYDVRGIAGEQFTEDVARALGAAFADFLGAEDMIVAHDMRVSSPALSSAFIDGAVRRGATVGDAGLSSTDQLYCASGHHQAAGAMFTASHNPAPDNGIKMCLPGAKPISKSTGLADIQARAEAYLRDGEIPERAGGTREKVETLSDYIDTVLRLVPLTDRRPLRVVVDAANAMAGHTVPALSARLPWLEVIPLYFELDGTFPNHEANPLDSENLRDLQAAVREHGADLGLAFDGDADRCFVVDNHGEPVSPSAVTALIATREIARAQREGEQTPAVVANLVSSRHVQEAIEAAGGRRVRSQVGHSLIKALMAEHNAIFGGEHSAHYYFRDFYFADSGMLAALHVIAALTETEGTLSELMATHSPYVASGEINSRVEDAQAARDLVREHMAPIPDVEIDDLDGMTVTHWNEDLPVSERWWFSLRSSNTEPLLRLNVEAAEVATMERVRDEVLGIIRQPASPEREQNPAQSAKSDASLAVSAGAASEVTASGAEVPAWVRERIVCPLCHGAVTDVEGALRCDACEKTYDISGGIPVLIPER